MRSTNYQPATAETYQHLRQGRRKFSSLRSSRTFCGGRLLVPYRHFGTKYRAHH